MAQLWTRHEDKVEQCIENNVYKCSLSWNSVVWVRLQDLLSSRALPCELGGAHLCLDHWIMHCFFRTRPLTHFIMRGKKRTKERLTRRSSERFHSADESHIVVTIPSETCWQWLSLNLHHPLSYRSWLMADGVPSTLQHHHLSYHHRTSPYCSKPLPLERRYTSSPIATAMCSKSKS
jgi:hypothetical protein